MAVAVPGFDIEDLVLATGQAGRCRASVTGTAE